MKYKKTVAKIFAIFVLEGTHVPGKHTRCYRPP